MARRADVLCAGGCGQLIFRGRGSLPPGQARCLTCRRANPGKQWICAGCGVSFWARGKRQFCSLSCSSSDPARHRKRGPSRRKDCEVCGTSYIDKSGGQQRTCSRACGLKIKIMPIRPKAPKLHMIRIRWCTQCGAWFVSKGPQLTCSEACAHEAKRAYDLAYNSTRPRKPPPPETPCITCGEGSFPFPPRNCPACKREIKRASKRRRRVLELGAQSEPYTLAEIAKRDHNRCGICHKRIAMAQAAPHPRSPSIDHMVPLARGGDDTRANVQLAHFLCNARKGDRGGHEQLALVG
jgi:hypothetical protein